jgi:hypothetical protein
MEEANEFISQFVGTKDLPSPERELLLAEETARTPDEALKLYEEGVRAGERALGPRGVRGGRGTLLEDA